MLSGIKLAEARVAAGLTQAQLADKVGVTAARISAWERTSVQPQARLFTRLLVALDVPASALMTAQSSQITLSGLRKGAGLTVDDVVAATAIPVRLYRSLEAGKRVNDPPADVVHALAGLFVLEQDAILTAIRAARPV